ncbi:hypothetical protein BDF22DRAFT_684183 [Syncephalis plumigaleata]|nr:hypothetical protein BDF22DRAFT_684183 [Syncephalis plumigaleata]
MSFTARTRLSAVMLRPLLLRKHMNLARSSLFISNRMIKRSLASYKDYDADMDSYRRVFPVNATNNNSSGSSSNNPQHRPLRLGDVLPELATETQDGTVKAATTSTADSSTTDKEKRKSSAKRALYDLPWLIIKMTVAFGAATLAAGGIGFMGLHAFAEYYAAPDKQLPSEVRALLRGAYVRDTLLPEPAAKALVLMEVSTAEIPRTAIVATHYWLAYTLERLGRLSEAADLYPWSKPTERLAATTSASTSSSSSMVAVSRRLGETLTRLGNLEEAGRVLWAAVYAANPLDIDHSQLKSMLPVTSNHVSHYSPEAVRCVVSLANVLALQRQFDDALTLYAGALRAAQAGIERERKTGQKATLYWSHTAVPASNTWTCLDAQVMGHLAEIYAIQNDLSRADEWSNRGLTLSKAETGQPACDACTGMILGNMALLKEANGNIQEAQQLFSRAHSYAKKAGDVQAMMEFGMKARQLRKSMEDKSTNDSN